MKKRIWISCLATSCLLGLTSCSFDSFFPTPNQNSSSVEISVPSRYAVTFYVSSGTSTRVYHSCQAKEGESCESFPSNPSLTGYLFQGWYDDKGKVFTASTPVYSDMNVFARFEEQTLHISFDLNGGNMDSATCITLRADSELTLPLPKKEGKRFLGWTTHLESGVIDYQAGQSIRVRASLSLIAAWNAYDITFLNAKGEVEKKLSVTAGELPVAPATEKEISYDSSYYYEYNGYPTLVRAYHDKSYSKAYRATKILSDSQLDFGYASEYDERTNSSRTVAEIFGLRTNSYKEFALPLTIGGYPLRRISSSAFFGLDFSKVILPYTLESGNPFFNAGDGDKEILIYGNETNLEKGLVYKDGCLYNEERMSLLGVDASFSSFVEGLTSIKENALYRSKLSSIVVPSSVKTIDGGLLLDNPYIERVTIPDSFSSSIPNCFVSNCQNLTDIHIGEGVAIIEVGAFRDLPSLNSVYLGAKANIVNGAFINCGEPNISVSKDNPTLSGGSGLLCSKDGSVLYDGSRDGYIPSSVKTIAANAFFEEKITSIHIPSTVEAIESNAFASCNLSFVTLAEGLKELQFGAFANNEKLSSVSLPNSLTTLGNFLYGTKISKLEVPANVSSCRFSDFVSNSPTLELTISKDNPYFEKEGGVYYELASATALCYDKGVSNTDRSVSIREGTKAIAEHFSSWDNYLAEIVLPSSIQSIGSYAFANSKLSTLYVPRGSKSLAPYAFAYMDRLTDLYIPKNVENVGYNVAYTSQVINIHLEASIVPSSWDSNWNINSSGEAHKILLGEEFPY